ncbi:hypothetical protein OFY17_05685 [Marinomonas sp. C2222]|uniref:DUF4139 domain-containing protein n=1 Tax=Marinomonas sargassi TaxID=2984494 RepID=A0ABT2YR67_9GAMM|nr:hypothetical protein [Marinomonas sargassi]MCV2402378.1 hypothetical protein [Marinomonas sargassi]
MLRSLFIYCFGSLLISSAAYATSINAVIGLDRSQVLEHGKNKLAIIPGSLTPLEESFPAILQSQKTPHDKWVYQINKNIRIEHKQRDLSFTGQLISVQSPMATFDIKIGNHVSQLPLNDFYLFPLEKEDSLAEATIPYVPLSYQTEELTWTPQLSLIIEGSRIAILQNAMLHNHSNIDITLENTLLHYFKQPVTQLTKSNRNLTAMAMEVAPQTQVQNIDNEILYPLSGKNIQIPARSDLLYPLPSSKSFIDKQMHSATLYTHQNSRGEIPLNFDYQLTFKLEKDSLPGQYQILWKKGQLLIPSRSIAISKARAGNIINVTTNKSQDISGQLTLLEASSRQLPSFQTWQTIITNHSSQVQNYAITHNTNAVVNLIKGKGVEKINANGVMVSGQVKPHSTKTVTYQIELKN